MALDQNLQNRTTITVPEIAARMGIGQGTVYQMVKDREIPNIRHGRRFIISRAAFERWEARIGEDRQDRTPANIEVMRLPLKPRLFAMAA